MRFEIVQTCNDFLLQFAYTTVFITYVTAEAAAKRAAEAEAKKAAAAEAAAAKKSAPSESADAKKAAAGEPLITFNTYTFRSLFRNGTSLLTLCFCLANFS